MATNKKVVKAGTEVARQAFIYQGVTTTKELCEIGGIAETTVSRHIDQWKKEREQMLKDANGTGMTTSLSVPDEVLQAHKADLAFFRSNLDILKAEHDSLDTCLDEMMQFCRNFEGDEAKFDKFIAIFDRYCRLSMNKKNLMSQIMKIKDLWDSKSGVDSLKSVQEATAKAVSIASAKSEPKDEELKDKSVVSDVVFRKRI